MAATIQLATSADLPAMIALLGELFEQETEFTADPEAQKHGLQRILEDPQLGRLLVLREEGRIVGMVNVLFTVSTALGERVAWLEDMVITADARGRGLGSQLIKAAIAAAREAGCHRITLLTDADNAIAQQFYRQQGFVTSEMRVMRLHL